MKIQVDLTGREVDLLLRYGSPFEAERERLEQFAGKSGTYQIKIDGDDVQMLIADIVYSAKKISDRGLLEEIDELATTLECSMPT